jgi:hypothetical protein
MNSFSGLGTSTESKPAAAASGFAFNFNSNSKPAAPSSGGFSFKPKEPEAKPAKQDNNEGDNEEPEENENEPYFEPIVKLDEVEVKTGEEDDEVLFCCRAKLFRFVNGEWKERGLGDMKILRNKNSNKSRILMRRENIHKLCANHLIPSTISLATQGGNEKTRMWFAMDGTMEDEEPSVQQFCVRFKEPKSASDFEEIIMKEKDNIPTDQTGPPKITEVKVKTEKVEQKKPEEKPSTLASILAQPV